MWAPSERLSLANVNMHDEEGADAIIVFDGVAAPPPVLSSFCVEEPLLRVRGERERDPPQTVRLDAIFGPLWSLLPSCALLANARVLIGAFTSEVPSMFLAGLPRCEASVGAVDA